MAQFSMNAQQEQSKRGQVFFDASTGEYYTFQSQPSNRFPFNQSVRVPIGNSLMANNAPAQQRPTALTPRAGVGPSLQSIYGGAAQPQVNPYPAGQAPQRPSFLPQFDMNAVLARAQQARANQTQPQGQPSFMARPSMSMAPNQGVQPAPAQNVGNPNAGLASLLPSPTGA